MGMTDTPLSSEKRKSLWRSQKLSRLVGLLGLALILVTLPLLFGGCSSGTSAPTLTQPSLSPLAGNESTVFSFGVTYTDADNDAPSYVRVTIDQTAYDMQKVVSGETEYSDGVVYVYSTTLPVGNYTYSFSASDGDDSATLPVTGSYTGPSVGFAPTEYPLSVTDLTGRSVEIDQKPVRIVTTHPTAIETLYAVGGVAIGRDAFSSYPEAVQSLPIVGTPYAINTEAVAALNPDLIIIEALTQKDSLLSPLSQLGVPVVVVGAMTLQDIYHSMTLVGRIVDMNDAAALAVADIQERIDAAEANAPQGKSVLIFVGDAEQNIYAARADSYPGTVADLLGLNNLAATLEGPSPYPGFALFTAEMAAQSDPDVILTITPAPPPAPRLSEVLPMIPVFKDMTAVKEGRVIELDPVLFLQAEGPRIADAVEELLTIISSYA
jgi:iron complex transport system substrate-binding protein